ncbi:MAG TPA: flagellar hook-basal body complex protein FliE [Rhizomicrobium sp.]
MVAPLAGVAAYQATAKLGGSAAGSAATQGAGFGDFLTSAMKDAIGTMKQGEQAAAQQAAGKGDMVSVVNAVNQAELTLDTVVAVRDKVIQAYQSIMQMPI